MRQDFRNDGRGGRYGERALNFDEKNMAANLCIFLYNIYKITNVIRVIV